MRDVFQDNAMPYFIVGMVVVVVLVIYSLVRASYDPEPGETVHIQSQPPEGENYGPGTVTDPVP